MVLVQSPTRDAKYARFDTKIIAHSPRFIPVLLIGLTNGVDIVDADDPLFLGELDFSAEIVHVADERAEDFSVARLRIRAHQVDDMLCEIGVESASFVLVALGCVCRPVGSHDVGVLLQCSDGIWSRNAVESWAFWKHRLRSHLYILG